ncbi:MAG: ABC transporter ATP-binding protein [Gammaproteobacteria bacterium]|jgi:putative ABC transport system ATP-binding protein|nr:ABC transporter ATP-binding protein [Gammaproteobacteria bacterium]MBT5406137.1 ABC transporter ATP-binding protein [Gammaproteobacteria bacterium]MBT5644284.1 ABC transporter ATP-binding protein [Gammaproteobacteria bacterium]MBT5862943.1 ABC transporter ATP-binding protein [Gammaproteobacteria bacterium]MBT7236821.1 ABC transporter ATP-binding protein [Gammaproteobacteria bacterium]
MLSCINISKHFLLGNSLKSVKVLKDVSLNIDAGQITALKGPSGSGKSTLLNLISGLEEPSYGEIYLNKTCLNKLSINELSSFRNNNIGIIFQFFNLINDLSILENISLPLLLRGVTKKTAEQNARVLIDNIGLLDRIDYKTNLLSGGECQRVAIARALITEPKIILADEPTGNLDAKNTLNVMKLLISNCRMNNTSLLMVTHDESLISEFDKVLMLDSGKIV